MLGLSRLWNAAATRMLYRELDFDLTAWSEKTQRKVQLLNRIASHPESSADSGSNLNVETRDDDAGIHIHSLKIRTTPFFTTDERQAVEQAVIRALKCMPNLKSLDISTSSNFLIDILNPPSDLVSSTALSVTFPYPFQLERFSLYTSTSAPPSSLDVILSHQTRIECLKCHYTRGDPPADHLVNDFRSFLPRLRVLSAESDESLLLIKGRPVTHCRIMYFTSLALELLAQSTKPIVCLAIVRKMTDSGLDPRSSLRHLEFLACQLPDVRLKNHISTLPELTLLLLWHPIVSV